MLGRTGKLYFNENEAARIIGVSVEGYRALLRRYIVDREEDVMNSSQTTFHASDVMLLRMFANQTLALPPAEDPVPAETAPAPPAVPESHSVPQF